MLVRIENREDLDQTASSGFLSISSLFLFSNKMLVIRAGIHKMLIRITNREGPDQTASAEAV